ncbi:Uncharacterised protein [Pragia fontium]|nr:Uncharacterised protein [Pragia fontium]
MNTPVFRGDYQVMAKAEQLSYNLQRELGWLVNSLMSRQDKGE